MKQKFKKIMSVVGSIVMVGSTIGMAAAAGGLFPSPFVQNSNADYAIVYGANAATSDITASNLFDTYLRDSYSTNNVISDTDVTSDFSSSSKVTYDDLVLGDSLTKTLNDNKITSLLDYSFKWDDGIDSKNYDVHEEILINGLNIQTTLDNKELNTSVVLENDKAIEYRYVFDDALVLSRIGDDDADTLYLTLLGNEYEVIDIDSNSITVSLAKEISQTVGSSFTIDSTTLTINDIYEDTIEINGQFIKEGRTKTVEGIKVYVENIAYHSSIEGHTNKVLLKVGKDIEKTFDDGDKYIEDDETWEWIIDDPGTVNGYIGVKYMRSNVGYDEDDPKENAIFTEQSYILPENYGAVSFDKLTDVSYDDFELSFNDKKLYGGEITNGTNYDVAILEGDNEDSIIIGGYETDNLYFKYNKAGNNVTMYFKDIDGDIDSSNEGRNQFINLYTFGAAESKVYNNIAKLVVDDTEVSVGVILDNTFSDKVTLTLTEPNTNVIKIPLGIKDSKFNMLGVTEEDAESEDVIVEDVNIGTREDNVMDHYGTIINDPENYADDDKVLISIPSEQVYASISVKGQGETITTTENVTSTDTSQLGGVIVKDTEIASVKDKNLILVGGSCINAEVAKLLGGKTCGEDFTLQTGVINGQALIRSMASLQNANKVAVIVAGYSAADTTRGVNYVINNDIDLTVGQKKII